MKEFRRLLITAEGPSEERFIKNVLSTHLGAFNISTDVRRVMTSKDRYREYRGGVISFKKFENDIKRWMKENRNQSVRFSCMIDLYRLPSDFPGYEEAQNYEDPYQKVAILEKALAEQIGDDRFIPYFMLHEFETLIFADLDKLNEEYFDREKEVEELRSQLDEVNGNPELVNDRPEKAPSKRIKSLIPEYDKVNSGAIVLNNAGIDILRKHCPHFDQWIDQLEKI